MLYTNAEMEACQLMTDAGLIPTRTGLSYDPIKKGSEIVLELAERIKNERVRSLLDANT